MTSPRGSLDETGEMHAGPTTDVMPVAAPPVALPSPILPEERRRSGWPVAWAAAAGAAAFFVALSFAWAGDGIDRPLDTTTTVGVEAVDTTIAANPKPKKGEAPPITEAPTTTAPEVVSDPEETDRFPEGFPFQDTGPPGQEKKDDD